jgi:hypothetical protein
MGLTTDGREIAEVFASGGPAQLFSAAIASGQSLSGPVALGTTRLFGILVPAGWTAAGLSYQASVDGVNYFELYTDAGTEVTSIVAASQVVVLSSPVQWLGISYLKVRSGTVGIPVAQGSAVTLTLIGVP